MAEWENRLGQDSPLARALRLAMPEDMRNPLLHPESVNNFALPPKQPTAELRNPAPRPGDYLSPVSEALSPTMSAYGLGSALGDVYVKGREGDYRGMASPLAEILLSMAPVPGMKKGAMPPRVENPIKAYHGSPHDFDRFKLDNVGREAGTAFGRGLYFAENEVTAQGYKRPIWSGGDGAPGHMYEVAIHATPEQLLDWDKPLSQQGEAVQTALKSIEVDPRGFQGEVVPDALGRGWIARTYNGRQHWTTTEAEARSYLSDPPVGNVHHFDTPEATNKLSEAGLSGIRYRDDGGAGGNNYVVFDPTIIEILRKYGLLGPVAAGATANALMGDKSEQ